MKQTVDSASVVSIATALSRHLSDHSRPPDLSTLRAIYSAQWRQLADIVSLAAETGESNSALLIGPRGVGKTALLTAVLDELCCGSDDSSLVVRLHGLLQTDDRLAIQEITEQLQLTATVGHKSFGSFAENLTFLLAALRTGDRRALKTLVFVLDEFDLFCEHRNQTLLYNLFDVAQSAQTPVCVIGLTARLDVLELLEKRVKSRFSHRQLCLHGAVIFSDYRTVALSYLLCPTGSTDIDVHTVHAWNGHVTALLQHDDVNGCLRRLFNLSRDLRQLKSYLVICEAMCAGRLLEAADFQNVTNLLSEDPRQNMLLGLSILELCLVIAMRHLSQVYEEPFNFEMVLREFGKFSAKNSTFSSFTRPVVMKAFENIQSLELIRGADGSSGGGMGGSARGLKEFQLFTLMVTSRQIMEAVKLIDAVPTEVTQWATTAIL